MILGHIKPLFNQPTRAIGHPAADRMISDGVAAVALKLSLHGRNKIWCCVQQSAIQVKKQRVKVEHGLGGLPRADHVVNIHIPLVQLIGLGDRVVEKAGHLIYV